MMMLEVFKIMLPLLMENIGNYKVNQYAILNALGSTPATKLLLLRLNCLLILLNQVKVLLFKQNLLEILVFNNSLRTIATKDTSNENAVFFNRMVVTRKMLRIK